MSTAAVGGAGAAPLQYRVSARAAHGGDAEVTAGQTFIPRDAGWATPPTGAPGPADLLGSAFAACLLKNLARSGALLGFEYDDAQVDVLLRRQDAPAKFVSVQYALRIATKEPQRRIELGHTNLRKFGTVYNTLREAQDTTDQVRPALEQQFAIANVTLESECGAAVTTPGSEATCAGADNPAAPTRHED